MTKISLIAAVDQNYGLGLNNQLLCHLPADLQHFKSTTLGKPIIMGSKTFKSIGKALPGRQNIVLTKNTANFDLPGIEIASSLEEGILLANNAEEIMIIGGASLYNQCMAHAENIYLTLIHHTFEADVFFPSIDDRQWRCLHALFRESDNKNPYPMTFYHFARQ